MAQAHVVSHMHLLREKADQETLLVDGLCRRVLELRRQLETLKYPDDVRGSAIKLLANVTLELEAIQDDLLTLRPSGTAAA